MTTPSPVASTPAATGSSMVALYRRLLQLRRAQPALRLGRQQRLDLGVSVVGWSRTLGVDEFRMAVNFGGVAVEVDLAGQVVEGSQRRGEPFDGVLQPDEAVILAS